MERIGFFGGCFNPLTVAHILLIKQVIRQENLAKVYFVPMGDWYPKKDLISLEHRKRMLELALEKEEKLEILELANPTQKTYAIDTFEKIEKQFPEADRFFIMGTDNYEKMKTWKDQEKLQKYQYIVLDRKAGKTKNISSTIVRKKIKKQESFEDFVPSQIINYIKENNLYK